MLTTRFIAKLRLASLKSPRAYDIATDGLSTTAVHESVHFTTPTACIAPRSRVIGSLGDVLSGADSEIGTVDSAWGSDADGNHPEAGLLA